MKILILALILALVGCMQDDVTGSDITMTATAEQKICGATACGANDGSQAWTDCYNFHCGDESGGGGGIGGGGGGGGGGGYGTGESCSGPDQSCRAGCFCKGGIWQYGTSLAPGICTYVVAADGSCGYAGF